MSVAVIETVTVTVTVTETVTVAVAVAGTDDRCAQYGWWWPPWPGRWGWGCGW